MSDDELTVKAKRLHWWAGAICGSLVFIAGGVWAVAMAYTGKADKSDVTAIEHRTTVLEEQGRAINWKLDLILEQHGRSCDGK